MNFNREFFYTRQQGAILIVGMIMLLIMTMVGVSIISDATIQERMASNGQQVSKARANAHSSLAEGEKFIAGLNLDRQADVIRRFSGDNDGLFIPLYSALNRVDTPAVDMGVPQNWNNANSIEVSSITSGAKKPRYQVEFIGHLNNAGGYGKVSLDSEEQFRQDALPLVFRVTAIGYGDSPKSAAILQSIYSTQQGVAVIK